MRAFSEVTGQWQPGGTAYDLRRERVGAAIWARFFACGVGFVGLGWLITRYVRSLHSLQQKMHLRLERQYLPRLLPYLLWHLLLRILALGALAALTWMLAVQVLDPILRAYPEYMPRVLVEPSEISLTFWNIRRAASNAVVLRTPQVIRLLYFGELCNIGVIVTLAGLWVAALRRRK